MNKLISESVSELENEKSTELKGSKLNLKKIKSDNFNLISSGRKSPDISSSSE